MRNGSGEPMHGVFVQSESLAALETELNVIKMQIDIVGGKQPEVIWVDTVEGYRATLKKVWPDAAIKQDIFHVINRYNDKIPENHAMRWVLPAAAAYRLAHNMAPAAEVLYNTPQFCAFFRRKGLRW
ncbi:hypothetical protein CHLNCDRAFT_133760 [Chlorella variabilis]|uniref:Uncharacterized protein n=1 Tax=Chlorella variabilis TaxID=554065 RepID=E1ZF66_CHLVA|nr:hypothetical protein CHLNCDRAFT_133760 [Chlorella variabilis]EFN55616.1 hypothetical protein CHLNCDRAFT_133760 [Chlorella variabilis]|eukprot:XP_005847718.1 hypothetical protein CHLNCDRAFT_133760 [Chlorella variabilis]